MQAGEEVRWHALELEEVLKKLDTSLEGLSNDEARKRLEKYGPNEIKTEKGVSPWRILLGQFESPLVLMLLLATGLSFLIGELTDAITIVAIVIASALLGFYQEYKAERAVEALKKMAALTARVLRDGKEVTVKASEVVPGDILILQAGDKVAADARIIESINLRVDEAPLTGESYSVEKTSGKVPPETPVPDRINMVFSGTVVTYGKGTAVVVATGHNTELGKIAKTIQEAGKKETPLERRMAYLGKLLAALSLSTAAFVAVVGIFIWKYDILTMAFWAISLAVAAVPEALPAVVTGALAVGMYRMAKRNAIITRLPAVETLGSTTYICADKTGTMTKGEMTARKIYVSNRIIDVTGSGYDPKGELLINGEKVDPRKVKELELLLLAGVLNNDARIEEVEEKRTIVGDTTEGALLVLAEKAGINIEEVKSTYPRIGEIPFSSERKRMSTFHKTPENEYYLFIKGAPEVIISLCRYIMKNGEIVELTDEEREKIKKVNDDFARKGLRNLAFAFRVAGEEEVSSPHEKHESDLVFLGLVGMMDPPRPEVKEALELCRRAGISVAMITGDHKLTAVAIAKELGLYGEGDLVLTGADLDTMSFDELLKVVEKTRVYARVSPEHKLSIVRALKKRGHIVAMTGDGVNDAPALKAADIGIAMGITGTEVAKEASDMILADDNFATIVAAVKEGREIFENVRKYLSYLLRCNIAEIIIPLLATFFALPLPFYAVHYLWINLVTDGLPALALGIDPADPDIMERPPRKPDAPVLSRQEVLLFLVFTPILASALLLGDFAYNYHILGKSETEARTVLFTSMILTELLLALSTRSLRYSVFKVGVFKNKFLILALIASLLMQLMILYVPPLAVAFKVVPPTGNDWIQAIAIAGAVFIIIETLKTIFLSKS